MHFFFSVFSACSCFILGHSLKNHFSVFHFSGNVPFINLLLVYILLSSPVCLIEYIYLLNNRSYRIFQYGLITFSCADDAYNYSDYFWQGYNLVYMGIAGW